MNGILPLWKETGMTSHDCVFKLRKILGTKKVGHTGTLDPAVEGVLPICIGRSTKVAEYITDSGKEYIAVISIGQATETEDAEGEIIATDDSLKSFSRDEILQVLQKLTGEIKQVPPLYSAVKVNGRKLYEYARKGIPVERPERMVTIQELELLDSEMQFKGEQVEFTIRIACGKGTYIRTLAVQIGEYLGYPAHMASLIRTVSGSFTKSDCFTLTEVEKFMHQGEIDKILHPLENALSDFPSIELEEEMYGKIINGQVLPQHSILTQEPFVVFTHEGRAVALYKRHPSKTGLMKPEKMF